MPDRGVKSKLAAECVDAVGHVGAAAAGGAGGVEADAVISHLEGQVAVVVGRAAP